MERNEMKILEAKYKDLMEGRFLCFIKEIKEYKGKRKSRLRREWMEREKIIDLICEGVGMKK